MEGEGVVDAIEAFRCPITDEILLDPVVTGDGHTYSRAAIAQWFRDHKTSPLTGADLRTKELLPNHAMRKAIEEARAQQPLAIDPGRLRICEDQVLGEGSHGRVVAGTLSLGNRRTVKVAVKMLPGMSRTEEREVFNRELKPHMLAARHCDGVCQLHGTCELPGLRMALVMKRYERSLRAMIAAAGGPLDAATVRRLAHSLFKTLAQLAAAGIVCRDIKTDNILLDEYGEPVLADFGISVVLETATHIAPTSIQGTFNYMSPEALNDQAEGGIGPHTDVWALGCVIVEMLTGEMPWAGMPMQQIMMAVAVQFRVPAVPEGAPEEDLLRRCFSRAPRDRPTAAQLAEAFAPADPPPAMENMELEQILQQTLEANERLEERVAQLRLDKHREEMRRLEAESTLKSVERRANELQSQVPSETVKIKEVIREVPVQVIKEVIKEVPVEVVKEVIREVPVEVIKEVIKEVPVEVIREVEKVVYVDRHKEERGGAGAGAAGAGGSQYSAMLQAQLANLGAYESVEVQRRREQQMQQQQMYQQQQMGYGQQTTFFHGTTEENALQIQEHGFRIPDGPGGLLGRGVYCTSTLAKAMEYLKGRYGVVVLQLSVDLGKCKQLKPNDPMMTTWQNQYDSAWAPFSANNPNAIGKEEICVKDPKRIRVVQAVAGNTGLLGRGGYAIMHGKLYKVGPR